MHMKFLAIFFIALALWAEISLGQSLFEQNTFSQNTFGQNPLRNQNSFSQNSFGQNPFGTDDSSTGNMCQCFGRRRWTRFCCEGSEGFIQSDLCVQGRAGRFLRCCQAQGLRGTCSAK